VHCFFKESTLKNWIFNYGTFEELNIFMGLLISHDEGKKTRQFLVVSLSEWSWRDSQIWLT